MKETGLPCTQEMVKAYLEGRKHQTRRLRGLNEINKAPDLWTATRTLNTATFAFFQTKDGQPSEPIIRVKCPYGQVGDRIYIKETWAQAINIADGDTGTLYYRATNETNWQGKWKSPRFMPKAYARIRRVINEIRLERVQDITEDDAKAEGITGKVFPIAAFRHLWDSINAKRGYSWKSNPFVWVVVTD